MLLTPRIGFILGRITMPFLKVLIILFIFGGIYSGYNKIKDRFAELESAKITIVKQTKIISDLNSEILKNVESNKITLDVVTTIEEKKEIVKQKISVKKKMVEKKIAEIEILEIPKEDKNLQKSALYINDLYSTYCAVDVNNCHPGA